MQGEDRRRYLRRRYLSLGLGELAAAAAFGWLAAALVAPRVSGDGSLITFVVALVPLLVILVQAGGYWLLARSWVHAQRMPARVARVYRVFRVVDVVLLLAAAVYVALNLPSSPGVVVLTVVVWLFAVVEYVNYYVVRLSYPAAQWLTRVGEWRTPRLLHDLRTVGREPSRSRAHP